MACAAPTNDPSTGSGSGGSSGGGTSSGGATGSGSGGLTGGGSGGSGSGGTTSATGSGGAGSGSGGSTGTGSGGFSGTGSGGQTGTGSGGALGTGGTTSTGSGGTTSGGSGGVSGTGGAAAGSGGTTGAGGRSGSGGASNTSACKSGEPTPASGGANFPFPQRRFGAMCIYPSTCQDNDAATGWQKYKSRFIVDGGNNTLRVQRPENGNDTVSEGIAYGMLFAVYLNDKATFDKLWQYAQNFLDTNGLMHWHINASGTVAGMNSATDSDEDMAFALVMADKQWGGYTTAAKDFLAIVAAKDFQTDGTIRGGDTYNDVNPSYLAPAYYRVFAAYTGETRWTTILDKAYDTLSAAANTTTGLVPDWSTGSRGRTYTYDAARTPFRIALDACWHGEARAVAYSQKIGAFFAGVGAASIKDGYTLDGQATGQYSNSTFIGPAGVAGMAANQTKLVMDAYTKVATDSTDGTESYYNLSWALFSTLMMTGNFVDLAGG